MPNINGNFNIKINERNESTHQHKHQHQISNSVNKIFRNRKWNESDTYIIIFCLEQKWTTQINYIAVVV